MPYSGQVPLLSWKGVGWKEIIWVCGCPENCKTGCRGVAAKGHSRDEETTVPGYQTGQGWRQGCEICRQETVYRGQWVCWGSQQCRAPSSTPTYGLLGLARRTTTENTNMEHEQTEMKNWWTRLFAVYFCVWCEISEWDLGF